MFVQVRVRQPFHDRKASGGFLLVKASGSGSGHPRMDFVFHDETGRVVYEHGVEAPGSPDNPCPQTLPGGVEVVSS